MFFSRKVVAVLAIAALLVAVAVPAVLTPIFTLTAVQARPTVQREVPRPSLQLTALHSPNLLRAPPAL